MATDYIPLLCELMGFDRIAQSIYSGNQVGIVNGWVYEITADGEVLMRLYLDGVYAHYQICANDKNAQQTPSL